MVVTKNRFSLFLTASILLFPILFGSSISAETKGQNTGEILVPNICHMSKKELSELKKKSDLGDCKASMRLHDYYGFCTKYIYLSLHYGVLAIEQGCEEARSSVKNMENALGIEELPEVYKPKAYQGSSDNAGKPHV